MPSWLALLLAAILSLVPPLAVAAPAPDESMMMDASCMMPGEDDVGLSMVCATVGGCVVLPTVRALSQPIKWRRAVEAPPAAAIRAGWNQAPEPPPPRPCVA